MILSSTNDFSKHVCRSGDQKNLHLCHPKIHHSSYNSKTLDTTHMNRVLALISYFLIIQFSIIFPPTPMLPRGLFSLGISNISYTRISSTRGATGTTHPSFENPNNTYIVLTAVSRRPTTVNEI